VKRTKSKSLTLLSAFGQIGFLTGISRVSGFFRDIAFASFLGAGLTADALLVALKLPNMFRRLSAEGAMTNAFLPHFVKIYEEEGKKSAIKLAAEAQIFVIIVLSCVVGIAEIFMPQVIRLLAPGFVDTPERLNVAIDLARITMPYLPMVSVTALWVAIANSYHRFVAGAAVQIIVNICFIIGALAIPFFVSSPDDITAYPIVGSLLFAGILQLTLLYLVLKKIDALPQITWPRISLAGQAMWRKFWPAALGAGWMQLNLLVDLILASTLPVGAISWLYYADRVVQLPLGIIGIALGTALLPRLSAAELSGGKKEVVETIEEAISLAGFFIIPAVMALIIISKPIISGLFNYGAFSANDVHMAALAMSAYAIGLPGFVLIKLMQPAFFAAGKPSIVLRISIITVLINISGSLILMPNFGHVGLALATSVSGICAACLLTVILCRQNRVGSGNLALLGRIFLASVVMGISLVAIDLYLRRFFPEFPAVLSLSVLVTTGVAVFGFFAFTFRAVPGSFLKRLPYLGA